MYYFLKLCSILSTNAIGYKLSINIQLNLQLRFKDIFIDIRSTKNCIFIFYKYKCFFFIFSK